MTVNKVKDGASLTASVIGRIDTVTAPQFEEEMISSLEGVRDLVLDFSGLVYISSAGLRIVLRLKKIMDQQGTLKVVGVNDVVYEIFDVTGFTDIVTVEKA